MKTSMLLFTVLLAALLLTGCQSSTAPAPVPSSGGGEVPEDPGGLGAELNELEEAEGELNIEDLEDLEEDLNIEF